MMLQYQEIEVMRAISALLLFIVIIAGISQCQDNALIEACERDLPRSQSCKLVAIPDEDS